MADLSTTEKMKLEKLLEMESGYVLNFSNRTVKEFFLDNMGIDIFHTKYNYASGSKANRLRAFWTNEDNATVGKLLKSLLEYFKFQRELNNQIVTLSDSSLFDDCLKISDKLIIEPKDLKPFRQEVDHGIKKEKELSVLLTMFDELAKSIDYQRRGFLLEELLNRLFMIHDITVSKSFQRNNGGEQIDGAFYFQGWHYIVECKWTKKVADIRELDSLLGKVNRSGKQTMGLFLSVEGWSANVPPLLKQNPQKCIVLMDGYDLRCILCEAVLIEKLLSSKITKLNLETEPFLSAVEIMNANG